MCFILHEKHQKEKIAKRDINCYKVLIIREGLLFSIFRRYPYKLGCRNKVVKLVANLYDYGAIARGYHSYSNENLAKRKGSLYCSEIVVKGVIPSGTKYYYNPKEKTYVSGTIILQERL